MRANRVLKYLLLLLPNQVKIWLLRRMGARIGNGCYIGASILDAKEIDLGDAVRIGHFNLVHRLCRLRMGTGSRINDFNWITGANTGGLTVGANSAITRLHFFEASGSIHIEDNSIVAGRSSHFFTHGITPTNLDDVRPIVVGPWCYVGSSSRFVPGSSIARGTFVGMGSVVTRRCEEEYVLIAGAPARVRKKLSPQDPYFSRAFLSHDHHPSGYDGCGL